MRYWAVIENNVVVNCIVADTKEIAEEVSGLICIEYYIPTVGDIYSNGSFISSIE